MGSKLTFEGIIALLRRALPFVAIGALLVGSAGLAYSLLSPKLYEATARVQVLAGTPSITANPDDPRQATALDPASVDTQVQILESQNVAAEVVRQAQLTRDPEFGGTTAKAIGRFDEALKIRRAGETALIDISVEARSPQRAAELANLTASAYARLERERKRAETQGANELLEDRVNEMAGQVREAEARVQAFRISNNLMSVNGTTLAEQSAAELGQSLATARASERAALAELASAQQARVPFETANTQSSISTLRAQQAQAQQEMSEAEARYGPRHPSFVAARERLAEINGAVAAESDRARASVAATQEQYVAGLRARAAAASNLRRSLEGSAGANQAGLARNSRAATQLGDLERQAAALRSTYETYLTRYQQTLSQLGTEQPAARIVAEAVAPSRPSSPDTKLNVLLGLLIGALAGASAVAAMMLFESHFTTAEQIERELDVEALTPLPTARSGELTARKDELSTAEIAALMREHPQSAFSESFKSLFASLDRSVDGRPNAVVALTSALPGEGKTTAALCLAQAAAWSGRRVLLVDADLRKQGVSRAAAPDARLGLGDVIAGRTEWRAAVITGPVTGLDLLPARTETDNLDLLSSSKIAELIERWRAAYDFVLLDTAPVLPVADTRVIARHVDSVMVACRWRKTPRRAVAFALELLGRSDAPIAGVAFTNVDLDAQAKYGLGDPTFYYRSYRSYFKTAA